MQLQQIAPIDESPLELVDLPEPQPDRGQVRIAVRTCGLCRTDLHIIEGDLPEQKLPVVPGHQIVGTVDAVGEGCSRLEVGQRVGVAWLRHTCGQCEFCQTDRENLCKDQRFTGYHADGGFAEKALAPEDFAYELPDAFDDVSAAPLLCAGIVGYRAFRRAEPRDGGSLAIYGFGSSAHVIAQIARHRGMDLYAVSRTESHLQLARDLGAVWAGTEAEEMPEPVESAIVFAPVGELVPVALKQLKRGGTLSLAGIHMSDIPAMNYHDTLFYERDVHSVTANTRQDGQDFLAEAARAGVSAQTTTYPLHAANEGLQDIKHDRLTGTGVLVISED
jgi:propanol-preferring alcohol dehydrogenase